MLDAIVLIFPWLVALLATPRLVGWAHAHGFVDRPGGRKSHERPTPHIGGVAVFGSAALGLALAAPLYAPIRAGLWGEGSLSVLGLGVGCMLALGVVDDKLDLRPSVKAAAQVGIAALTWLLGFRVGHVELLAGWITVDAALPSFLFTVAWIVVVTNAFNLIDGIDGLATGIGVIAMLTLFWLATGNKETVPVVAALAIAGSLAGFLRYNLPPARIFLGDSGALPLGYAAAVISIATYQKASTAMVIALPLVALGVPMLDVLLAVVRRGISHVRKQGMRGVTPGAVMRAVFRADSGHIHHLLQRSGWSVRRILFSLWVLSGALAVTALAMQDLDPTARWSVVTVCVLAGLAWLRRLERRVARLEGAPEPVSAQPAPRPASGHPRLGEAGREVEAARLVDRPG